MSAAPRLGPASAALGLLPPFVAALRHHHLELAHVDSGWDGAGVAVNRRRRLARGARCRRLLILPARAGPNPQVSSARDEFVVVGRIEAPLTATQQLRISSQ